MTIAQYAYTRQSWPQPLQSIPPLKLEKAEKCQSIQPFHPIYSHPSVNHSKMLVTTSSQEQVSQQYLTFKCFDQRLVLIRSALAAAGRVLKIDQFFGCCGCIIQAIVNDINLSKFETSRYSWNIQRPWQWLSVGRPMRGSLCADTLVRDFSRRCFEFLTVISQHIPPMRIKISGEFFGWKSSTSIGHVWCTLDWGI